MAGHKLALITDTHFGIRKGSQIFHNYFADFYNGTFFQYLDDNHIDTVVHLGDCFDVRKGIDYWSLDWAKRNFFDPLRDRNIQLHLIVGNHDIFYKESLSINAPGLNLQEYDNITVYQDPGTATIAGCPIFMVPWICESNADEFAEELAYSEAKVCMGHLELAGFYANKDYKCDHGTDPNHFSKFDRAFSGHFHKKSSQGNITYLGNPYQIYWNDEGETRGFHLFDKESGELEFVPNPTNMFHKIYCSETTEVDSDKFKNTFVKLIIDDNLITPVRISQIVDSLYDSSCHDVKVIENVSYVAEGDVEVEAEDTLTTLTNYVNLLEDTVDKESLVNIFKSLYVEAQEV